MKISSIMATLLLAAFVLMNAIIVQGSIITVEDPMIHNSYIDPDPGAQAGTVTGEHNDNDGNWDTYIEIRSNGDSTYAIVFHVDETWAIPTDITTAYFNVKIEAPETYVFQGHQDVYFWNYNSNDWDWIKLAGSYQYEVPPPLSGILEASIELSPDWISNSGEIKTSLYFFQKHSEDSWSRLYETSITYVPEPATLILLCFGSLAVTQKGN